MAKTCSKSEHLEHETLAPDASAGVASAGFALLAMTYIERIWLLAWFRMQEETC
jgi:hypothetical protein